MGQILTVSWAMTRFFLLLTAQIGGLQNLLTAEKLAEILTANSDSSSPIQTLIQKLIQIFFFSVVSWIIISEPDKRIQNNQPVSTNSKNYTFDLIICLAIDLRIIIFFPRTWSRLWYLISQELNWKYAAWRGRVFLTKLEALRNVVKRSLEHLIYPLSQN